MQPFLKRHSVYQQKGYLYIIVKAYSTGDSAYFFAICQNLLLTAIHFPNTWSIPPFHSVRFCEISQHLIDHRLSQFVLPIYWLVAGTLFKKPLQKFVNYNGISLLSHEVLSLPALFTYPFMGGSMYSFGVI